jgi:hypothetical protein
MLKLWVENKRLLSCIEVWQTEEEENILNWHRNVLEYMEQIKKPTSGFFFYSFVLASHLHWEVRMRRKSML